MAPTWQRRAHAVVGRPVRRRAGSADGRVHALDRRRRELALDDIAGSIAHVRGLGRAGLLTDDEVATLVAGLAALRAEVEARHARVGPGARGRPPQPRGALAASDRPARPASSTPVARATTRSPPTCGSGRAARSTASTAPSSGWSGRSSAWPSARATPSCRARPTSSPPSRCSSPTTCWPTSRCSSATGAASPTRARRLNVSPLGVGALAGAGYPLDRETTAAELGFDGVTANSLDAVADRDFVVEFAGRDGARDGPPVAGSPRRSRGGRTRASGSCASPTRSRPARR